jgi:hypothetical protein
MAIFVSNPPSAAVPTLSSDALDPSALAPEEGFTEELAAAMQPSAVPTDASAKPLLDKPEDAGKKASDLQILPAEVLMNAVGDANFALAAQAGAANSTAQNTVAGTVLTDANESLEQDTTGLDLADSLQGAELAAANLAAQMAAAAVNVPVPAASNPAEVSAALAISATSGTGQEDGQALQAPTSGSNLQQGEQVASAAHLASPQSLPSSNTESISSATVSTGSQAAMASVVTVSAEQAVSAQADATRNASQLNAKFVGDAKSQNAVTEAASIPLKPDGIQADTPLINQISRQAGSQLDVDPSLTLNSDGNSTIANVSSAAVANEASLKTASSVDSTAAVPVNSSSAAQSLTDGQVVTEKTTVSSDTQAEAQASQAQESAFNFDAKLAKSDAQQNPKVLETAVSLSGVPKSNVQLQQASLTSNDKVRGGQAGATTGALASSQISTPAAAVADTSEIDSEATTFNNVQPSIRTERKGEAFPATASSPTASTAPANRLDSAALAAANPNSAVMAQEAPRAETTQSLEDISSSFVSSLVGGPQRPVTTVMDWISMQSQERPAPLVPHEVRLDAGAVQMEIQKMVKQGGGHVVMELTPPDQSKFTIELKLDERGNALLIVEGVSDSTKTRLEQSAPQLREQFQQMGLELQLDMRQQGQFASSNAANFADAQERGSGDNNLANNGTGDMPKVLTQREAGANRARETGSNQVYLYA